MKSYKRIWIAVLALSLTLSGCAAVQEQLSKLPFVKSEPAQTEAPVQTEVPAETAAPAAEIAPETVPAETEPEEVKPVMWKLQDTVLPETNEATGTLFIYVNGTPVYAGGKVSDLIDAGIHTYADLDTPVGPRQMSDVVRVRVDIPGEEDDAKEPLLFFVAMNPGKEPAPIRDCLFFSLTVNLEEGVEFGTGKESKPFVTEVTTRQEIEAAYGKPTEVNSDTGKYAQTVYYQPFNCVYFTFKNDLVRQVFTYYSANVFGDLAAEMPQELQNNYFGADCFILMSRYLDVTDYLPGHALALEAGEDDNLHIQRSKDDLPKAGETGVFETLPLEITMNGEKVEMGIRFKELPETWWKNFQGLMMPVERDFFYRVGRNAMEEFYIINDKGQEDGAYKPDELGVKGVITRNRNYTNWGKDFSGFYEFNYDGLTQDSTIEEIVAKYGQPSRLYCSSNARVCFAWMHYDAADGSTLRLKVDPMTDQLMELRVTKFFPYEIHY